MFLGPSMIVVKKRLHSVFQPEEYDAKLIVDLVSCSHQDMTAITRTSPLNLGEVRRTQRRAAALLNAPDFCDFCIGRRRRIPAGFCYVCSQLQPRGRGGGASNPYRYLFSKGPLRPCPHIPPLVPHPTLIGSDDEDYEFEDDEDEDDGFDEGSLDLDGSEGEGGVFDTSILRDDGSQDPRIFSLPPVFGTEQQDPQHLKQKRRSKKGRLVPMISENTFLSTNKRPSDLQPDSSKPNIGGGDDLRLPELSNQRTPLVTSTGPEAEVGGGSQGDGKRKSKDPRILKSERIDRHVSGDFAAGRATRSDSALEFGLAQSDTGMSREKTDPPPQPIIVSIKNQDGEAVQKIPLENLPPGTIPSESFTEQQRGKQRRKRREKKRRPQSRNGSVSPSFSGSMTISRETTLSGLDSPDYFLSRLRSASWCECPDHRANESRCTECRKLNDHEKWCVSRNSICQNCGKAFKRKYSQLERKSSFSTIPASGMIISNVPNSGSPSRNRHQNCSPTKTSNPQPESSGLTREASTNRVRFHEDGKVVYPQWETFPDSGVEEDKDQDEGTTTTTAPKSKTDKGGKSQSERKSHPPSLDANIHQRAYKLALADAKLKAMFPQKKSKGRSLQHPNGVYFSYFPLLKRRQPQMNTEISVSPTPLQQTIGFRADMREGKRLKVKKGLKHILGDVKLDDYYPGGKHYPK